ncbi:Os08g0169201 [Oryza sativa Japonica Group]|uniref:Os08g0169201 protein n=1 Tax=Oryza sativa subsp. japonica TaxID=39947 RepID=A0A0P0XC86_ORYSJ|nr:Os08g0169201 [Oryza sativa Japonica Group]
MLSTRSRDTLVSWYTPSSAEVKIPDTVRNLMSRCRNGLLFSAIGRVASRSGREAEPPLRWMALGIPRSIAHLRAMDSMCRQAWQHSSAWACRSSASSASVPVVLSGAGNGMG